MSTWPESLSILDHMEDVADLAKFLEAHQSQILDLDEDYLVLAGSAMSIIQERGDPMLLLQEAASRVSLQQNNDFKCLL